MAEGYGKGREDVGGRIEEAVGTEAENGGREEEGGNIGIQLRIEIEKGKISF